MCRAALAGSSVQLIPKGASEIHRIMEPFQCKRKGKRSDNKRRMTWIRDWKTGRVKTRIVLNRFNNNNKIRKEAGSKNPGEIQNSDSEITNHYKDCRAAANVFHLYGCTWNHEERFTNIERSHACGREFGHLTSRKDGVRQVCWRIVIEKLILERHSTQNWDKSRLQCPSQDGHAPRYPHVYTLGKRDKLLFLDMGLATFSMLLLKLWSLNKFEQPSGETAYY